VRSRLFIALALMLGCCCQAKPARAQELVTDLTDHLVQITTAFHGANVVLFGTAPGGGDVIVTVRGPARDVVVRRKERVAGIRLNDKGVALTGVPGFYAVFASRPLDQLLSPSGLRLEGIGLESLPLAAVDADRRDDIAPYRAALVQDFVTRHLYYDSPGQVKFLGGKLFRATVAFPADTPVGVYTIESFLVRDGSVVASDSTPFAVEKAGLPAEINDFSRDHGLTYGILAVCAVALMGWVSTLLFRRV
jgi:uncharacterized protein (TIGR02186 family)